MSAVQRLAAKPGTVGVLIVLAVLSSHCGSQPKPTGPPGDEELERLNRSAHLAFEKRRITQAADLYRRALEQAFVRSDLTAVVNARFNLAVCLMELNDYHEALDMIGRALWELFSAGRPVPPDVHLLQAAILYRDGRLPQALDATDVIIDSQPEHPPGILSKTYFLRGLIAADNGDAERLHEAISAITKTRDVSDDTLRADRAELVGRLAMIEKQWDRAVAALDRAVALRRQNLEYRRMAIALAFSAQSCESAGRHQDAALRYMQAGRSAAYAGNTAGAEKWLENAIRSAERGNAPGIARQARYYLDHFRDSQKEMPADAGSAGR